MSLRLVPGEPQSPARAAAEQYVKDAFRRSHGARVRTFMPQLLMLESTAGTLRGVVGLRAAAGGPLYLERYLDEAIEVTLSRRIGIAAARQELVEIGNLACDDRACARELLALLPWFLMRAGYRWVAFTGTRTVRDMVQGLGGSLVELCRADAERVAGTGDAWGAYYERDPRVMVGFLPQVRQLPSFRSAPAEA